MRDNGELFFLILLGVAACGLVLGIGIGIALGAKITRSDMYSRCISENKTMVYEEVHKLCTERYR